MAILIVVLSIIATGVFVFTKSTDAQRETIMKYIFLISAFVAVLSTGLICFFLFLQSIPAINEIGFINFLLGREWRPQDVPPSWGIAPMVIGSILVTFGAALLGVPIAILTAIYMDKFCPKKLYKYLRAAIELLAGIPSIVYGFFGMVLLVPAIRELLGAKGPNIISASILLAIMILPTITSIAEVSIKSVPSQYYEGSLALGATHERSVFFVVVPAAKSGVLAGIILGIGRAIGETMAVIMVAGNQPAMPKSLLSGVRTLTANIVIEMGYAAGLHRQALIATGAVLFVFILIINFSFIYLTKRA